MSAQKYAFGELIKLSRTKMGMTMEQLGELLGKSKTSVMDMERERTIPHNDTDLFNKIAFHLKIDVEDLYSAAFISRNGLSDLQDRRDVEFFSDLLLTRDANSRSPGHEEITRARPMSQKAIAQNATSFWSAEFGESCPVDIMSLYQNINNSSRCVGGGTIKVSASMFELNEEASSVEGRTMYNPTTKTINVALRSDVWQRALDGHGRARFSAAHELAHAVLHAGQLESQSFGSMFRDGAITPSQTLTLGGKIYESPEWQANVWASSLLMPTSCVDDFISKYKDFDSIPLADFADHFQVTMSAARIRLERFLANPTAG